MKKEVDLELMAQCSVEEWDMRANKAQENRR